MKEKNLKNPKERFDFLQSIMMDIKQLIKPEKYDNIYKEASSVLRHYFTFYASHEDYLADGLNFFSQFPQIIKQERFNSIKAFLFYFAYQTKNYSSQLVKELLGQNLINAIIIDNKTYLDFSMYCFYRGMYYLEIKDFYMASYYYCTAIEIGLKKNVNNMKLVNSFTAQMLRSLCFLRYLTHFNIKEALNRETRFSQFDENALIDYQDIAFCYNFLTKEKDDLKSFQDFIKEEGENIKKCNLQGLKNLAEEEIIFKILKDMLKMYKKIKMTKIAQKKQLEVNDIMRVLKKKVIEGEINIKYDESEDIIEVFEVDPGLKEKVKKTTDLYKKIIEGNKNLFTNLKTKKLDQLSGKMDERDAAHINIIDPEMMRDVDDIRMEDEDDYNN